MSFLALILQISGGMSIAEDWETHPILLVITTLLPVSILVIDVFIRFYKVLRNCYRQSKHFDVMTLADGWIVASVWLLFGIAFGSYLYHCYQNNLTLWLGDVGNKEERPYVLHLGGDADFPLPNTAIIFERLTVENSGPPCVITRWALVVILPDKEVLHPNTMEKGLDHFLGLPKSLYMPYENVVRYSSGRIIGRGEHISGFGSFEIVGVNPMTIREVGTKLRIDIEDSLGHRHSVTKLIDARESTTPPSSDSYIPDSTKR
jgi:hypothetical protein